MAAENSQVEYWLSIRFNSNEHPWSNDHYNSYPKFGMTRDEAIDWAAGMADHVGDYTITLFGDGEVIPYDQAQQTSAQGDAEFGEATSRQEPQATRPAHKR